jgi:hypothetical protein
MRNLHLVVGICRIHLSLIASSWSVEGPSLFIQRCPCASVYAQITLVKSVFTSSLRSGAHARYHHATGDAAAGSYAASNPARTLHQAMTIKRSLTVIIVHTPWHRRWLSHLISMACSSRELRYGSYSNRKAARSPIVPMHCASGTQYRDSWAQMWF